MISPNLYFVDILLMCQPTAGKMGVRFPHPQNVSSCPAWLRDSNVQEPQGARLSPVLFSVRLMQMGYLGGGDALCDSTVPLHVHPLALWTRDCRTQFNSIISPPRLPMTSCYVQVVGVQKSTRRSFAFEEHPKLIRETNIGRAGEKGWVGKI